jgi:hypothetical protein
MILGAILLNGINSASPVPSKSSRRRWYMVRKRQDNQSHIDIIELK